MSRVATILFSVAGLLLVGCNNDLAPSERLPISVTIDPFELCKSMSSPPAGCGVATCERGDPDCPEGTFCYDSVCTAACTEFEGCGSDESCSDRGRCVPDLADGGVYPDGGSCIDVRVTPTRITPNVLFIVDQSGSMRGDFGNTKRWTAAHDAISEVVSESSNVARFGLVTYTASIQAMCPVISTLDLNFGLTSISDNNSSFPRDYSSLTMSNTPTGDSIDEVVRMLNATPPPGDNPTVFVLATDGAPDQCEDFDTHGTAARNEAVSAVRNAYNAGFDTYVLSVGDGSVPLDHLQEVANVGVGQNRTSGTAPFYEGRNPAELTNHFKTIVGAQVTCDVDLNGNVGNRGRVCDGNITLNGQALECENNSRGWRLKDGTSDTIELLGSACTEWKQGNGTLDAVFPCGVITPE